jgi:hypothetical protein
MMKFWRFALWASIAMNAALIISALLTKPYEA